MVTHTIKILRPERRKIFKVCLTILHSGWCFTTLSMKGLMLLLGTPFNTSLNIGLSQLCLSVWWISVYITV